MGMARQSDPSRQASPGIPVLVTRPRAQAEIFAHKLTARFGSRVRPYVAPLMAPQFLSPPVPEGRFAAVIFTSAHGVEGAVRLGTQLPRLAYCVGRATAAAAAAAGFDARSSDGDVSDLAATLLSGPKAGRFLYLRGVDTVGELENRLISNDIPVLSLQVYLQKDLPLEGESFLLLRHPGLVILPLFSPRSARIFRDARPADTVADLAIAAMSKPVASAATGIPHRALVIAERPDAEAMLDAVESLLAAAPLP
ncbi:MAG: uroporphyrinogen-III synthase [Pseudomonadota bacterium]